MLSDLHEYAEKIGIDLDTEKHLLYLAEDALHTKLPTNWKPWLVCVKNERKKIFFFSFSQDHEEWYYFNTVTGLSQWEHPIDHRYRQVVKQARQSSKI